MSLLILSFYAGFQFYCIKRKISLSLQSILISRGHSVKEDNQNTTLPGKETVLELGSSSHIITYLPQFSSLASFNWPPRPEEMEHLANDWGLQFVTQKDPKSNAFFWGVIWWFLEGVRVWRLSGSFKKKGKGKEGGSNNILKENLFFRSMSRRILLTGGKGTMIYLSQLKFLNIYSFFTYFYSLPSGQDLGKLCGCLNHLGWWNKMGWTRGDEPDVPHFLGFG